ncbi:MAG: redoxin domain-containing protein [Syntrophales bacterium]|jgi:peroxiredoxin (alkyl hydroperoxide reductase subunit C)|nr:redoxin domain-containing protein [Syntrophales bacterium]MCK9392298.1 redoxin domain-containing protein [Syntrophales bacterium]
MTIIVSGVIKYRVVKKNVMLTFIPAAWPPVCSDQWSGYNIVADLFAAHDAVILGISVENLK